MSFLLDLSSDVVPSNSVLPAGKYNVVCEEANIKETKDGSGEYINARFSVIDEAFNNRKVFMMFNIKNKNEQAVTIGRQQLKSFLIAAGTENFALTSVKALEGMKAKVTVNVKADSYGEKNNITKFDKCEIEGATFSGSDTPF